MRILSLQDVSCVGQCSLTVALPIISACGIETAIMPSAVLSTHTGGFTGWTFRDLTDDLDGIAAHWKKEGIAFDALYTGYLGSQRQIDIAAALMSSVLKPGAARIVDPAMADNGRLYSGFDEVFARKMGSLCALADFTLPNITEACFMTGTAFRENGASDAVWTRELLDRTLALGAKKVVLKGLIDGDRLGVAVADSATGAVETYFHERLAPSFHGTGDVFASAFTGAVLRGRAPVDAVRIAAEFVVACIRRTRNEPDHAYGVCFEPVLPQLIAALGA